MEKVANFLDTINLWTGLLVRWLIIIMLLIQFSVVLLRYIFGYSSIMLNESVLYLHATVFMLAAGYTLLVDKHVRIDIFYDNASSRVQHAINLFGHIFLLIPAMLALLYWSFPTVYNAWKIKEGALSVGGIPATWALKSLIPLFCILLIVQSVSCVLRILAHFSGATK